MASCSADIVAVGTAEWGVSFTPAFHPEGNWIATINDARPAIWPLGGPHPQVFPAYAVKLVFAPLPVPGLLLPPGELSMAVWGTLFTE